MSEQYVYQVARIRTLEVSLFSAGTIEQLIDSGSYENCMHFLEDRGWGDEGSNQTAEDMLSMEEQKLWKTVGELKTDVRNFDVLRLPKQFQTLKSAIKEAAAGELKSNIYYDDEWLSKMNIRKIVKDGDLSKLPDSMSAAATEALESLLHTGDGQLCDIIIDKACLEAIYDAGKKSDSSLVMDYAEAVVAMANVKTAVRSSKTGKSLDFMKRAMAECKTLDVGKLAKAAEAGMVELTDYLATTPYADGLEYLDESMSSFERWCDDRIMRAVKPQKYKSFGIGPVIAYILARLSEIKTVRIILSGKLKGIPDSSIRERVRQTYV